MIRPLRGSSHRIYWHPASGNVRLSDIDVVVVTFSEKGPWIKLMGMKVLPVTWEEWERMVDKGSE